jgi:hypothetical protein
MGLMEDKAPAGKPKIVFSLAPFSSSSGTPSSGFSLLLEKGSFQK